MPPTLVAAAVGALIGVALLGAAFDRRSVALVGVAATFPDLDSLVGPLGVGATNATFHTLFVPLIAAALLYYDTSVAERSRLGDRYGWYGIRVAWVAVAAYAVAGIGLDLFSAEGVALLYPLSDRYYAVVGGFLLSTQEGIVQTYVAFDGGRIELASPGSVETHRIDTWLDPAGEERRLRLVRSGWQAVIVATAAVAVPLKGIVERRDRIAAGGR